MVDETTDNSTTQQLIIYGKYLDHDTEGKLVVVVKYLDLISPKSGSTEDLKVPLFLHYLSTQDAIQHCLNSFRLPLKKLVGFGSDGCNTMLGEKGSVAIKLKENGSPLLTAFHCPAHHLQLAIMDIADKVCSFFASY